MSSRAGKAAFAERRRRAHIAVIVAGDTLEEIFRQVVGALAPVRKQ